jgi:HSP20 family protein
MSSSITPFDRMEQFVDQMFTGGLPAAEWGMGGTVVRTETTADGIAIMADLPGFEKAEIDLRVHDLRLHISATHEEDGERHHYSRRVREQVSLPDDVVIEEISAAYHNGVLEVTVPTESAANADEGHHIAIE